MKILVIQDWLRSGGTERQTVFLVNAFAAAGHDVTLLTFRPGGRLAGTVAPAVKRRALQPFDTRLDWFIPGLFGYVERDPPDTVLCMGRMANCWAHLVQNVVKDRWPHTAVICTMRTGKKLPWLFRRSLHAARHVVANSQDARRTLTSEYGIPGEKISVIYNSLVFTSPTEDETLAAARLRREYGADAGTTVLLCVAMFRPEKNQRELIDIAAGLPKGTRFQLWLAGDGPARRQCEQRVQDLQLSDRVRFVGFHANPSALYAAANVAVHASWSESLSNFLIEAQAQGLPAVAYEAQGIRECFIPDVTGWAIARNDREGFRQRLALLINEPADAHARRAEHARRFARATFDPATQVAAYQELFTRLRKP
jgi:glycosyltransferase involved in cell wall biosynthesis